MGSIPHPRGYVALQASTPPTIDGHLEDDAWREAPWSEAFVDITGNPALRPTRATRVKMLWDATHLYVGAHLEEPQPWATLTLHDSVIFHDNDFEIFIDPDGDNAMYYEFEFNAYGTVWDLLLVRPYRDGGPPLMAWDTIKPSEATMLDGPSGWSPITRAVHVDGVLNNGTARSRGWYVEVALPWTVLCQAAQGITCPPVVGSSYRINFSRVQWNVTWDDVTQQYVKSPPEQAENNWVWSPQYLVNMHFPETWGYVQFSGQTTGQTTGQKRGEPHIALTHNHTHSNENYVPYNNNNSSSSSSSNMRSTMPSSTMHNVPSSSAMYTNTPTATPQHPPFTPDPSWPIRSFLMQVYYAQQLHWQQHSKYSNDLQELGVSVLKIEGLVGLWVEKTRGSFLVSVEWHPPPPVPLYRASRCHLFTVNEESRLRHAPVPCPAGDEGVMV